MANINAKTEVITPDVAKCYLEHNSINRTPNKGQIAYLAKMMQSGEWQLNGEAIVFSEDGRLLDGQHRLMACLHANVPFETLVVRGVDDTAFSTFDLGKTRDKGDVLKIAGVANSRTIATIVGKYLTLKHHPNVLTRKDGLVGNSLHADKLTVGEVMDEYNRSPEFWQDMLSFASACYGRCRLTRRCDIGGITAYLNKEKGYDINYVMNFFEQIFFEEKTEMNVFRLLRTKLIDDAMKAGRVRMTEKYKTQLVIKAWEAYKNNKDVSCLKWTPNVEPERVFE